MRQSLLGLFVGLVLISSPVSAEQCTFDFPHYFVTNDGRLGLYLGRNGHWWYPCGLSTSRNGVTLESCKTAYSSVLTAKLSNKPMTFSWTGTCDEIENPTQSITDRGFVWMGIYNL